jgi:P27 family predicted phage terminase small subunit
MTRPLTAEQLRLRGTFRGDRHAGKAAVLAGWPKGRPQKPKFVRGQAARVWREVCDGMMEQGTLSPLDRTAVAAFAILTAEQIALKQMLDREGYTVRRRDGKEAPHPALKLIDANHRLLMKLARELLTPAARAKAGL